MHPIFIEESVAECVKASLEKKNFMVTTFDKLENIDEDLASVCAGLIVSHSTAVTEKLLKPFEHLQIIVVAGSGSANVNRKATNSRTIFVTSCPEATASSAVEFTMLMLLMSQKMKPTTPLTVKDGKWNEGLQLGRDLRGLTLGLIGLGRIGKEVALVAQAMNMFTVAYDPYVSIPEATAKKIEIKNLEEVLLVSDIISLHAPAVEETYHMVNEEFLSKMKDDATLINTSRGSLIDEAALVKVLKKGKLNAVCLDVFNKEPAKKSNPLLKFPNVIATPHMGGWTENTQKRMGLYASKKIINFFQD